MKNKFLLLFLSASLFSFGQHHCGFEEAHREVEKKHPESKRKREEIERKLKEKGTFGVLQEYGFVSTFPTGGLKAMSNSSSYTGEIYEVPIVVHVIETSTDTKLSDAQIQQWVDNANKMYATTYGNGFFEEGSGPNGGTVMPFKLVLAKRTPDCMATSGIVRYDASHIQEYVQNGIRNVLNSNNTKGVSLDDLKTQLKAGHWPEAHYYNIYLVTGVGGAKGAVGTMGWAYDPTVPNYQYETVIRASTVTIQNDATLAHEFGHSLGLGHPFGRRVAGAKCTSIISTDDDSVADTEPIMNLGGVSPVPSNNDINSCSGTNYQGGQYNVMNYSFERKKFTPGQRDRALALFLANRGSLVKSRGGQEPLTGNDAIVLNPAQCIPNTINEPNNPWGIGITKVQLRDIDNATPNLDKIYVDYSQNTCHAKVYTDIPDDEESTFVGESRGWNAQWIKVWIDYNNNGVFEESEKLGQKVVRNGDPKFTLNFRPPADAVKNTYLRMRVRGDEGDLGPCSGLRTGQIEDYAVRITTKNETGEGSGMVGINTENPSATLDVREVGLDLLPSGTPQGVNFPSFTMEQRSKFENIKEGMMIYNKDLKCIEIYVNNAWKCM